MCLQGNGMQSKKDFKFLYFFIFVVLCGAGYIASAAMDDRSSVVFATWEGLEPDKWASIWLINRFISPNSPINIIVSGEHISEGIAFGVPESNYKRTVNSSTFESLIAGFQVSDQVVNEIAVIINVLETTKWDTKSDPLVNVVEQNYRLMQDRFGYKYVSIHCFGQFFDILYDGLLNGNDKADIDRKLFESVNSMQCDEVVKNNGKYLDNAEKTAVEIVPLPLLMSEISDDKAIIFLDVREPEEYSKSHIPGAINIPMRGLNESVYDDLKKADRVISYCVKDFRGYEVARKLSANGVANVGVMSPHGFSGWVASGLPVTSAIESEQLSITRLKECANGSASCLTL